VTPTATMPANRLRSEAMTVTLQFISIVVPAYNEAGRIGECIRRAAAAAGRLAPAVEVIVVDDGSDDGTAAEAEAAVAAAGGDSADATSRSGTGTAAGPSPCHTRVVCLRLPMNRGKGRALRTGIAASRGQIVVLLDADLDIPPEALTGLVEAVAAGRPLVVASRGLPRSTVAAPLLRRVMSRGYRLWATILTGLRLRDTQCGLKAGKGPLLRRLAAATRVNGFAWDLELLALADGLGCPVTELPVQVVCRPKGRRLKGRDLLLALSDTWRVARRRRAAAARTAHGAAADARCSLPVEDGSGPRGEGFAPRPGRTREEGGGPV